MDRHATASQRLASERKSLRTRIHFFVLLLVRGISKVDSRCAYPQATKKGGITP